MANIKSAQKRAKQSIVRTARNKSNLSKVKTFIRKIETIIESGDKEQANKVFPSIMSAIHVGVRHGVLKKATASRKISRINARIKSL